MKKIFGLFLISIFMLTNSAIAEIDTTKPVMDFGKVNKKVLKYVAKAKEADTFQEKEQNLLYAAKYIKNKKSDDILLKAGVYYLIGSEAKAANDNDSAVKWFKTAYEYLEQNNKIKDNYLAFGCMMNIISITKKTKNIDLYNETLLKIEETQLGLSKDKSEEFRIIYGKLFEYYNNSGNKTKADEYEKLLKSY